MNAPAAEIAARQRLRVQGVVQGVGFRPFVYGLAARYGLAGFVGNNSAGVFIEIEGPPPALEAFAAALRAETPPLAHIETIACEELAQQGGSGFVIVHSEAQAGALTLVSPDIAVCDDCLRELFDPANRRYRYPFINCTHCGPRYTIIRSLPYDRPQTTMAAFPLCPNCQREYENPLDRRFHAQPIACPVCGPQVWLEIGGERLSERDAAITAAQARLAAGEILAIKGIGGFHLACDATNDDAVLRLRERKGRAGKPFALMVRDLDEARTIACVNEAEASILTSRARPIVLLESRPGAVSDQVAPGLRQIGVMLAYAPLHYLLLAGRPLVMTSGNWSGEPITYTDDAARERLAPLADAFLLHDRPIEQPCDDSVLRVFRGAALPVRRSRGYAPFPVHLPKSVPPLLAVGGELKNTFCLAAADHAFLSPHIGDVETLETVGALEHAVRHFERLYGITPERIVCDLHPGYASSRWAEREAERRGIPLVSVQHHHAHIAGLMAEHGLDGASPVLGVCFDGTGYGTDGAIWGGEVLLADYLGFRRLAHLKVVPLPGGDSAIRHPSRAALAHLWAADVLWTDDLPPVAATTPAERRVLLRQLETGFNAQPTSSAGRLFDALAAMAGLRQSVTYEAQAAMELEGLLGPLTSPSPLLVRPSSLTPLPQSEGNSPAAPVVLPLSGTERGPGGEVWPESRPDSRPGNSSSGSLPFSLREKGLGDERESLSTFFTLLPTNPVQIDAGPVIRAIAQDVRAGVPAAVSAAKFHTALAEATVRLLIQLRDVTGVNVAALSGGVFQNTALLGLVVDGLYHAGFEVLVHELTPPNDGGLALGQAIVGGLAAMGEEVRPCV
ncbi:MAG: carbamoyltransferase HypF [Anaerolineae bacterium]|nr:carbamoyltransferase HypF [Anaerolineae bacterium]